MAGQEIVDIPMADILWVRHRSCVVHTKNRGGGHEKVDTYKDMGSRPGKVFRPLRATHDRVH